MLPLKGATLLHVTNVFTPFHAAEQRSKERKNDSVIAKRHPDVARSLRAAQGSRPAVDQVIRLHFLLVRFLYACKENERLYSKHNLICYMQTALYLSPTYPHSIAGTHKPS